MTGASLLAAGLLVLLLWSPWKRSALAGSRPLTLSCAAGMTKPVAEILQQYEQEYGVKVEVRYAGSGELLSLLRAGGGRGDLYLAADASHIRIAQQNGLVAEALTIAGLRPVLVVNGATRKALDKKPIRQLRDVLRDDLQLVLADPDRASVGQLSKQLFEKHGLWNLVAQKLRESAPRVSTVGTVNEVAQRVLMRDGAAGIVWSGIAGQFTDLHVVPIPEFEGVREEMQVGVLTKSTQPIEALRLARYLAAADRGALVFKKHHFEPLADADVWERTPKLRLSAGAMLLPGIKDVVKEFSEREGVDVETTPGGCGLLVAQMKAIKSGQKSGVFPDAYFACDEAFLRDVQDWFEAGIAVARNPMVLVVARGNPHNVHTLADLAYPKLRVGLAHPQNSALGKLTDDLLHRLKLHDKVYAEDRPQPIIHTDAGHMLVNQVRAGALDAAVVYKSNVLSVPRHEEFLEAVDLNLADAIAQQPFAIARESRHKHLTARLFQALVSPANAQRFRDLGFKWIYQTK